MPSIDLERMKAALTRGQQPYTVWSLVGVPLPLVETLSERLYKAAIIAYNLACAIGLSPGVVLEKLVYSLALSEGIETEDRITNHDHAYTLAQLSIHLATALQAASYSAMGFATDEILREELDKTITLVSKLEAEQQEIILMIVDKIFRKKK